MNEPARHPQPSDATTLLLRVFEERIAESVRADETMDFDAQKVMLRTQRISRIAQGVAFIMTPVIFYLIGSLVLDMGTITDRMGQMSTHVSTMDNDFKEVSALMHAMDASVVNMSNNISVIPAINTQIAAMDTNFSQMTVSMQGIAPSVGEINRMLSIMEQDMAQMDALFGHLNYSMLFMGRNVNTMSRPMRWMPSFMKRN